MGLRAPNALQNVHLVAVYSEQAFLKSYLGRTYPTVNLDFNGSIEKHIQRISFEISNTCNYTNIHPECPVSCYKQSTILNKDIVIKTLDELAGYGYKGFIAFHRYQRPMINKEPTRRLIGTCSSEIKRLLFLHCVDYLLPLSTLRVKDALILI